MKKKIIEKILKLVQRKYPFIKDFKVKSDKYYSTYIWRVIVDKDKYLDYFNATEDMLDIDGPVGYVDRFLNMKYWEDDLKALGGSIDRFIVGVITIVINSHPKMEDLKIDELGSYYMDKTNTQMEHKIQKVIKKVINETALRHYKRKIQELRDLINNQVEMQDPCNFDDGDEYADFCISQGMGFFFGYDPWSDTDYGDDDDDDENIVDDKPEINMDEYNEINNEMTNEFYDELVALWDGYSDEC
jgi:hypothetical protein